MPNSRKKIIYHNLSTLTNTQSCVYLLPSSSSRTAGNIAHSCISVALCVSTSPPYRNKAYPVALSGRCIHHRPGFIVNTLQQPPPSPVFWGGRQRPRQAPRRSASTRASGLTAFCPPALEPSASVATIAWRSSSGGLYPTESPWYRQGPSATAAAVRYSGGCFSEGIRCPSSRRSSSISSSSGGGEAQEEAREASTAGASDATRDKARAEEEVVGHVDDGKDLSTSMAGVLGMEPLVERVASALAQRCSVRGGDLVRVSLSVCVFETAWESFVIARVSV